MANADDDLTYDSSYGAPGADPTKAPPSTLEYLGASWQNYVDGSNLTFSGLDLTSIFADSVKARPNNRLNLSREEAHKMLQEDGIDADLPVGTNYSSEYVRYLRDYNKRKMEREELFSRNESTLNYMLGVPTYLSAMVTDPITIATMFIPVVGEARYASALKTAGTSWTQRALVRAQMGAYEGAVGTVLTEPYPKQTLANHAHSPVGGKAFLVKILLDPLFEGLVKGKLLCVGESNGLAHSTKVRLP